MTTYACGWSCSKCGAGKTLVCAFDGNEREGTLEMRLERDGQAERHAATCGAVHMKIVGVFPTNTPKGKKR